MRIQTRLLLAAALPLLACIPYKPEPENGKQSCATTGTKLCPDNYVCIASRCYKEGSGPGSYAGNIGGAVGGAVGGAAGGALGGAAGGKVGSSSTMTASMECAPSGSTCSKTGIAIQFCCNSTDCKYTAGTLTYACNGTDCLSAYQSMTSACTATVPVAGSKVGGAGGGVGGAKVGGQSAGALAGSPGGMGGNAGGGARSSSSVAGSMGGNTTVAGMVCQDAGITCERSGTTIMGCCNSIGTECKLTAGTKEFPCIGADCDSAAQALVDYCMGTGGVAGSGGGGGATPPLGGVTTKPVGGSTSIRGGAGGTTTAVSPSSGQVSFMNGAAVGAMTGYAWVALAPLDIVTSPTCGLEAAPLSADVPCTTALNWNSPNALCLSGIIPALPASPTAADYEANWGIQIGVNPQVDPTGTLGRSYSSVAVSLVGAPAGGFRIMLHRKGDPDTISYCYDTTSGLAVPFTRFNTKCWGDATTVYLTSTDVPNLDRVGIQINSIQLTTVTLSNMCLNSISFGP